VLSCRDATECGVSSKPKPRCQVMAVRPAAALPCWTLSLTVKKRKVCYGGRF